MTISRVPLLDESTNVYYYVYVYVYVARHLRLSTNPIILLLGSADPTNKQRV